MIGVEMKKINLIRHPFFFFVKKILCATFLNNMIALFTIYLIIII